MKSDLVNERIFNNKHLAAIRIVAWSMLLCLGAIQAWQARHGLNPDGMSYLDIARAIAGGQFGESINGYWSPLYTWMLAFGLAVFQPDDRWHFAAAHATNFAIFVLALCAFEFFFRQLRAPHKSANQPAFAFPVSDQVLYFVAYVAFGAATLIWIGLANVTPDLMVAALVFLCSGLALRVVHLPHSKWAPYALGGALGLAYLTKAAMLPLSIAFLLPMALRARSLKTLAKVVVAMSLVAGPYIAALSITKDRPTAGDVARLNYAWFVDSVSVFKHWQGDNPITGAAAHPTRLLVAKPPTYEFAYPVRGTYPVWYDPSYWHEGLHVGFDIRRQWSRMLDEGVELRWIFAQLFWPVVAIGVLAAARAVSVERRDLLILLVPLGAAILMYALVHIEPRFLGAFVAVAVTGVSCRLMPRNITARRIVTAIVVVASLVVSSGFARPPLSGADLLAHSSTMNDTNAYGATADALKDAGVTDDHPIAFIGDGFRAYWAYVGHYRIGAESRPQDFWKSETKDRQRVLSVIHNAGIKDVVADARFGCRVDEGWQRVGVTGLCLHRTSRHSSGAD